MELRPNSLVLVPALVIRVELIPAEGAAIRVELIPAAGAAIQAELIILAEARAVVVGVSHREKFSQLLSIWRTNTRNVRRNCCGHFFLFLFILGRIFRTNQTS
jgi:hypothetical protein